jgi:deaminated glutathione amidase
MQVKCEADSLLKKKTAARAVMKSSLGRLRSQTLPALSFLGADVKLVVFPEFFLTDFSMGDPVPVWTEKAALEMDGPEYKAQGQLA